METEVVMKTVNWLGSLFRERGAGDLAPTDLNARGVPPILPPLTVTGGASRWPGTGAAVFV